MIKISKQLEYAIIILKFLALKKDQETLSAREIGEKFLLPYDSVAKTLKLLCSHNLVSSTQGVKGGYELSCKLDSINLFQLSEILGETPKKLACSEGKQDCDISEMCIVSDPLLHLQFQIENFFKSISLSDLLKLHQHDKNTHFFAHEEHQQ